MIWWRRRFQKKQREHQLDSELHFHFDALVAEQIRAGLSEPEARRKARLEFGGLEQVKEECRDAWGIRWAEDLFRDLRFAARSLKKSPVFTITAVATLALGIGTTTTMFSVVDGVLLEPMKYREPHQLFLARTLAIGPATPIVNLPINARHFHEWRANCQSCEQVALLRGTGFTLNGTGEPERFPGLEVSSNFFATLGVQPSLGRDFLPEEEFPGRSHVVLVTDSFWRAQLASDPSVVGRKLLIDGEPNVVIGVMPSTLHLPKGDQWGVYFQQKMNPVLFRPLGLDASTESGTNSFGHYAVIRLNPGVSKDQAAAEMSGDIGQFTHEMPVDLRIALTPLEDQVVGRARAGLWLLLCIVGAVLLIACVNVGSLILVRTVGRSREAGVRLALGAIRTQLFSLVLKEVSMLAVMGGTLGVIGAWMGLRMFTALAPLDLPRIEDVGMNWHVLAFAAATMAFAAFVCAIVPAWQFARTQPLESLKAGLAHASEGGRKLQIRQLMVSTEVALSTLLLIVGGLLTVSFFRVMRVEKGFDTRNTISQGVSLLSPRYREDPDRNRFIDEVLRKLGRIPGVEAVGVTSQLPLTSDINVVELLDTDKMRPKRPLVTANFAWVSPGYWKAMGIPLREGRLFLETDRSHLVAVISERAARSLWPDRAAVGRHINSGGKDRDHPLQVIGVVADVRTEGLEKQPPMAVYEPYWTAGEPGPTFVVRTRMEPPPIIRSMRAIFASVDPEVPLSPTKTMTQVVDESVGQRRFQMCLAVALAFSALVLVMLGIYGVVSSSVARRIPELGIRIALGAQGSKVIEMVLREGIFPILTGLAAGVLASIVVGRFISAQLYGVSPNDPVIVSCVAALLFVVGLCACYIPARRATRINPSEALRWE